VSPLTNVAHSIQRYFDNNMASLRWEKQLHYAERLGKITGQKKYLDQVERLIPQQMHEAKRLCALLTSDWSQEAKVLLASVKVLKPADKLKIELYKSDPYLLIVFRFLWFVYNSWLVTQKDPAPLADDLLETISQKLLKKETVRAVSSRVANSCYALEKVYNVPLVESYLNTVNLLKSSRKPDEITNWYYGLTHVLINESGYYQRFIPEYQNRQVTKLLIKDSPRIIQTENIDLALETAISTRLTGISLNAYETKLKKRLLSKYNGIYIPHEVSTNINDTEHRNVLTLIWIFLKEKQIKHFYPLS